MNDFFVRYIDNVLDRATIDVLKDWRKMEERLERAPVEIINAVERMTSIGGMSNSTPVQGGGNRREETLVDGLHAKILAEHAQEEARNYFAAILPAWQSLSERDRYLLTEQFIDGGNGTQRIMERLNIEKSAAYEWSNNALTRLREKLFW